jgi:hypothetical protein
MIFICLRFWEVEFDDLAVNLVLTINFGKSGKHLANLLAQVIFSRSVNLFALVQYFRIDWLQIMTQEACQLVKGL